MDPHPARYDPNPLAVVLNHYHDDANSTFHGYSQLQQIAIKTRVIIFCYGNLSLQAASLGELFWQKCCVGKLGQ